MKKFLKILIIIIAASILLRPPVNGGTITSWYGPRFAFDRVFHTGTDIALPTGTPINSISWGTVKATGFDEREGLFVTVNHLPGFYSRYLHLDSIKINNGDKVNGKTIIGNAGNTGISTGSHLHFEIRLFGIPLPPYLILIPGRLFQWAGGYKYLDMLFK